MLLPALRNEGTAFQARVWSAAASRRFCDVIYASQTSRRVDVP